MGNPEGSLSDPVTTDPKGEVRRVRLSRKTMRRTTRRPSSQSKETYGEAIDKDRATLLRVIDEVKG